MKPMLAAAVEDVTALRYPMIATPKIDGIRCVIWEGRVLARSLKPIPNVFVRESLAGAPEGLDGELIVGATFQSTTSGIMSHTGNPDFAFWVFDLISELPYEARLAALAALLLPARVERVPWVWVRSPEELLAYEAQYLADGFEGVCLRTPKSSYKFGRSTLKEGYLLKLKRFQDAEAVVVGFEEQQKNTNELLTNELGYAKRSSAREGLVGKGTLGKVVVEAGGVRFGIGTGFTDAQRAEVWANRERYLGQICKFKSQPYGVKDAPRLPVFLGWRDDRDV